MPRPPTRVLVMGDCGVGKTSIVHAAVTQSFSDAVPAVMPVDVTIPQKLTQGSLPALQISDFSSRPEDRESYWHQVQEGEFDALVLVYAADDDLSFDRTCSFWLPEIKERTRALGGGARRTAGPRAA